MRVISEEIVKSNSLQKKKIEFITGNHGNEIATQNMIKIAIFMPRIGNGIRKIEDLKEGQYAWTSIDKKELLSKSNTKIIAEEEILEPWKLIYKK